MLLWGIKEKQCRSNAICESTRLQNLHSNIISFSEAIKDKFDSLQEP